jgi:uncharacterized protein
VTATHILETLAEEFSSKPEHVQNALTMLDAGLSAPFIGRFRRSDIGGLSESFVRRIHRRRDELVELDRRRATIVALLQNQPNVSPEHLAQIQRTMDRFELEDLFIAHRKPEPEVQLALDRGLGGLADELVKQISKAERAAILGVSESELDHKDKAEDAAPEAAPEPAAEASEAHTQAAAEPVAAEGAPAEAAAEVEHEEETVAPAPTLESAPSVPLNIDPAAAMNAQLARICAAYVRPDREIHSESEALSGALRILSDRLGRDPKLRGQLRRLLSKQGVLSVKASAPESRLGRHKALLKIKQPLRQLQGHRLLAIRQAQKERVVQTHLSLDPKLGVPKVRAALGRFAHPAYEQVLGEVASQAFHQRLIPMLEQDVRIEVKDRADQEAVRFVSQSLRQLLSSPPLVGRDVVGVDVSPKGDWTCARVDAQGVVQGPAVRIETAGKDSAALGAEFGTAFPTQYELVVAVGNGKTARAVASALRAALKAAQRRAYVFEVNETGLSSYANSEVARTELAEFKVPERMAISIARRLQDPLLEFLKVESRGLSVGSEAGLLTKAAAKRLFRDTIEASVAHIGADINRAPLAFLTSLPGIDKETAQKILDRRAQAPITSREELRQEGILSEAQWTSVIAFLRVRGGSEPLDTTNLHPEQYPLIRRIADSMGAGLEQVLGRMGATKGLRRADFGVDEDTWRDAMRELSFPGRDPRPRQHLPELLEPGTDPVRLIKDRVVEGIVTSVSSFACFVDIGLAQDAMVHVSELSDRYVRDARELISVGTVVRARILEAEGKRLALSLKNVPRPERAERPPRGERPFRGGRGERGEDGGPRRGGRGERGEGGRGARGPRREREEAPLNPNLRAAQTRRDGLGVRASKSGRGGPGGRTGPGGPGRDGRGREEGGERDEPVRLDKSELGAKKVLSKPFAAFFKKDSETEGS